MAATRYGGPFAEVRRLSGVPQGRRAVLLPARRACPSDERMGQAMKYHHDRLHPREPRPSPSAAGALQTAGSTLPLPALSDLLDGDGAPQDFEQARCTPREPERRGSQRRADA